MKWTKNQENRENPKFSTRARNDPKGEMGIKDISLLLGSDSSTSPTIESENVTNLSGESDKTDMSETIYQFPHKTVSEAEVCQRLYHPGKFVYTPDMKFPFAQDSSSEEVKRKTHHRVKTRKITCKGSRRDLFISQVIDTHVRKNPG